MTRYRYFLLSSVLQFPYSFNVQQYRFSLPPQALGFAPYTENTAAAHASVESKSRRSYQMCRDVAADLRVCEL